MQQFVKSKILLTWLKFESQTSKPPRLGGELKYLLGVFEKFLLTHFGELQKIAFPIFTCIGAKNLCWLTYYAALGMASKYMREQKTDLLGWRQMSGMFCKKGPLVLIDLIL